MESSLQYMFLYLKERWITMIGTELQEIELIYDKEQNATIFNQEGN